VAAPAPCDRCRRHPPAFRSARAVALYLPAATGLNPLARAVQHLKYGGRRGVAETLGALLAERYPFADDALLVPVPLHHRRLRTRGFNQAVLLARALARRRHLALAPRALVRTRVTRAQPGLAATARRANLAGAFAVRRADLVAGRHVVLVDDVLTSGATADACARALRAAGATAVDVYTVGRAP
jgi:ComF family protein